VLPTDLHVLHVLRESPCSSIRSRQVPAQHFRSTSDVLGGLNALVRPDGTPMPGAEEHSSADGDAAIARMIVGLSLPELMHTKAAFESASSSTVPGSLAEASVLRMTSAQFVDFFSSRAPRSVRTDNEAMARRRAQLAYLFMRVDCDSDGFVTWSEFLSFALQTGAGKAGERPSERSGGGEEGAAEWTTEGMARSQEAHRESATHLVQLPSLAAFVSAAHDGTIRVWSRERLVLERTITVSAERQTMRNAQLLCVLAGAGKLAVVDNHAVLTFYELLHNESAERWSRYGQPCALKDAAPVALAAWKFPERATDAGRDAVECLALGLGDGTGP
jgi:hypothetical protein